ncbi:hypothetical protein Daura_45590 [Dactylosporangium aurantiacum]|uniref:Uncharacterized protein n=1 Tax=Dactylosporangium aurantiacum TaxID=35754 RepID=A0A9Q9MLF8_9ACTN|nr:hypothetical protein [Dactylosporangium aurantiacum]MDG6108082.1 hypothetical protein [Dactylosporangium aurantiacum]UWZ53712.1 hypothetical protein Daura_45590 [Dactylosporangium aurantiacum]
MGAFIRKMAPVAGLLVLAPFVGEFLLRIVFRELYESEGFLATPAQLTGAAVVAALLAAAAFLTRRRTAGAGRTGDGGAGDDAAVDGDAGEGGGWVPRPWLAGVCGFVLSGVFVARPESWAGVWTGAALLCLAAVVVPVFARRPRWTQGHHLAFAGGVLLTYAWLGFVLTWLLEPGDPVRWWGNALFAAVAVALLAGCRRVTRADRQRAPSASSPRSASATQ